MKDKAVAKLIAREEERQMKQIPLIASENFCSADVRAALASVFVNKYAEGQPGRRYYAGNTVADDLERLAQERALELFVPTKERADWRVNVQPLSGSPANLAVYAALLAPGDTILSMDLAAGGHLSHGHALTLPGRLYKIEHYGVKRSSEQINMVEVERLAKKHRPKLIIVGGSAYPRQLDFAAFAAVARCTGAYLLADISHIAGLVVGSQHPSPIPAADVVMTTTHKTLRGPRAALVFCRAELAAAINKGIFPGVQGGPHLNQIAAVAVALGEAAAPEFTKYATQVVRNARALADELEKGGLRLVTGGTDTHLVLADVTPLGLTGRAAQEALEAAGLITNANLIPFDGRPPLDPSGLRFGTAAITTLGYDERRTRALGRRIINVLRAA